VFTQAKEAWLHSESQVRLRQEQATEAANGAAFAEQVRVCPVSRLSVLGRMCAEASDGDAPSLAPSLSDSLPLTLSLLPVLTRLGCATCAGVRKGQGGSGS
jgi:hypothetical protein